MYLGVDGGGTKTALCLLREDGRIAAEAQAPSCYYFTEGIDLVGRVLQQGIDQVCEMASVTPADIRYAFFGLPTYGEVSGDVPTLDTIPGEIFGHGRYAYGNDTVCGWAGSLGGIDGINNVGGGDASSSPCATVRGKPRRGVPRGPEHMRQSHHKGEIV